MAGLAANPDGCAAECAPASEQRALAVWADDCAHFRRGAAPVSHPARDQKNAPHYRGRPGAVARQARTIEVRRPVPTCTAAEPEFGLFGAGHGTRTRDPELGKLVLYQLS